jgi:hypothetical protein
MRRAELEPPRQATVIPATVCFLMGIRGFCTGQFPASISIRYFSVKLERTGLDVHSTIVQSNFSDA